MNELANPCARCINMDTPIDSYPCIYCVEDPSYFQRTHETHMMFTKYFNTIRIGENDENCTV